ncbi:MAG: DUF63 family protein [Candidatus Syntropharchaeia archaeon]
MIWEFIEKYYISPIIHDTGYNPVNTITWALLLGLSIFLVFKLFKRLEIKIDGYFIASLIPYIFVGGTLRVVEDAELFPPPISYMLITPLIYFLIFFICLSMLILSVGLYRYNKIKDYRKFFFFIGTIWFFLNIAMLAQEKIMYPWVLFAVLGIVGGITSGIYEFSLKFGVKFLTDKLNLSVLAAHLADATSSYIGIDFLGYTGKHVVEGMIVKYAGSAIWMYPLKLGICIPVLYLLETEIDEDELKNLILLALLVIGLGPAVRNTTRMVLGI